MLNIYTAQYRYQGEDRVDITVKSALYPWSILAPTWSMVMEYKQTLDKEVYITAYDVIISKALQLHTKALSELINSDRTITLVCFCKSGDFCHRILLAKWFATMGAAYLGERKQD